MAIRQILRASGIQNSELDKYFTALPMDPDSGKGRFRGAFDKSGQQVDPMTGEFIQPTRRWWEHLPIGKQNYEDKLARYQTSYDRMMELDRREYEDYSSLTKRLTDAGLSPMLAYGGFNAGSAQASQASKPQQQSLSLTDGLSKIVGMRQAMANVQKTEADTRLINTNADAARKEYDLKHGSWEKMDHIMSTGDMSGLTAYQREYISGVRKKMQEAKTETERAKLMEMTVNWFMSNQIARWVGVAARFI